MSGFMNKHLIAQLLLLLVSSSLCLGGSKDADTCSQLEDFFSLDVETLFSNATMRRVDPLCGEDTEACLNEGKSNSPPLCKTISYALSRGNTSDLTVYLAPGEYNFTNTTTIADSQRVALIGSGANVTNASCELFLKDDKICDYRNFQIRRSSYVYVSGITFTRCGPVTSNVYIAQSNFVFFNECEFKDNLSPPLLVYDTPSILFNNTVFFNNTPRFLKPNISTHTCYFSGGQEIFFVDNRTTSGAISLYVEDWPTNILVNNCTFHNNSARPDDAVALVRRSEHYGHAGAVNIRLLNSSNSRVCIRYSSFFGNTAQAHAGALAISLAGNSNLNSFDITNSTFISNYCSIDKCTGGAVGIDFISLTQFNVITFSDTNFTKNKAQASGAIALSTSVSAVLNSDGISDMLVLKRCWFERNSAFFEGTALGAYSLTHTDQIGVPVEIHSCHFRDNVASQGSADTTAITAYRALVSFYGNNTFLNNQGGGISLLSSRMDVRGEILFDGNTAVFGGCIAMSGRSLVLLYDGSFIQFSNNFVSQLGAGIYVEYASSDVVLSVLNTGCFIRYFSDVVDLQPTDWNARMWFINNTAGLAGAAIYANDLSRCKWIGNLTGDYTIFQIQTNSPFLLQNNRVQANATTFIANEDLATDPSFLTAWTEFDPDNSTISYGEKVSFRLTTLDELQNFREAVWSVNIPQEPQSLGSLSSNGSTYQYDVPQKTTLLNDPAVMDINETSNTASITAEFSLLGSQATEFSVNFTVGKCHPGYDLDSKTQQCQCRDYERQIERCDSKNRYIYAREGLWANVRDDNSLYFTSAIPGFLNCSQLGSLPGCLVKFDDIDDQCVDGREGTLCGDCREGYGVTFDLRSCNSNCGARGIILFVFICFLTLALSLIVLFFDFPLPNELKGVIFFAQVIGVIYRNTPYVTQNDSSPAFRIFDFVINMFGFAMPFPVCLMENVPAEGIAFLGFIPPVIATLTAVTYACCANRVKMLSHRDHYGFHGFYLLFLFVYKYFVDTSFVFISCTNINGDYSFLYRGTLKCFEIPFVFLFVIGAILLLILGVILPTYVLYIIYQPQKMIQVSNALIHGLKSSRWYLWYGVWDIWRRLLFVAANLFIAVTTRSVVLFIHCQLILLCLAVICIVKPYQKYHINVTEMLMVLALFGATIAILDENDRYVGPITSRCFIAFPFVYGVLFLLYRGIVKIVGIVRLKGKKYERLQRIEEKAGKWNEKVERLKDKVTKFYDGTPAEEKTTDNFDESEYEKSDEKRNSESSDVAAFREPLLD